MLSERQRNVDIEDNWQCRVWTVLGGGGATLYVGVTCNSWLLVTANTLRPPWLWRRPTVISSMLKGGELE